MQKYIARGFLARLIRAQAARLTLEEFKAAERRLAEERAKGDVI